MTHTPSIIRLNRRRAGFSLIEVLIAVVVLSVGLLALGALQASLVRSASESKARAGALSLAEDRLERMRSFGDNYHSLTGLTETTADLGGTISGVDYTRTTTVQRFAFDRDTDAFVAVGSTADGTVAEAGDWAPGVEFKRIEVAVSWVDAQGGTSTVRVTDSLSSVSPGSGLPATSVSRVGARSPRVLISNPENIAGVIPIAIGDGTDTAATNPRPEVAGQGNNQAVIETRFEVLTYKGIGSSDLAEVQARVETIVVGCTCSATAGSGVGFRPTYWNGLRYVRPEATTSAPPAVHSPGGGNSPPQSPHCVACCRDHHDAGFSGPKFSPRLAATAHTGQYTEACRMIRVDGIVHTAADMSNDYFNLLATANLSNDPPPSATASGNYESFVLRYLGDRMVSGTAYNALPAQTTVEGYETQFSINEPALIQLLSRGDSKWLHSRGLYIDFLENDAVTAINNAKGLESCQGAALEGCVLRRVPFTSINLTELSNWTPASISSTGIVVTNNDFRQSLGSVEPVRGRVESISAIEGTRPQATASIMNSNAGVALILNEINGETTLSAAQTFQIVGRGSNPGGSPGTFQFTLSDYPLSISANRLPRILFVSPSGTGNVCNHATSGGSRPNPYSCSTSDISGAIAMSVRNYNFQDTQRYTLECRDLAGLNPESCNKSFPVCRNFAVTSVTGGVVGAVTDDGKGAEATAIAFTSIANAANLNMVFAEEAATLGSSCTYSSGNNNAQRCNNATVPDPCL